MSLNPTPSLLDQQQILQRVFDKDNDALRTDAFVQVDTISADLVVEISAADGDSVIVSDGVDNLAVNADGSINTVVTSSALPDGAATAARQDTGNASLASIDAGIPAALGQTTMAASMPVVIASDQSAIPSSQSGTWNITNVSGTVSLPTNAATETTLVKLTQTQSSTTSGQSGPLIQGAVTTSDPTYTTGQTNPLSLTTIGRLRSDVTGNVASASTDSGNPVKIGGTINLNGSSFTDAQRANAQMNAFGSIYVDPSGRIMSYSACTISLTTAATATDIFTITGSSTKTIKIRSVVVSGTNTGNTNALIVLLKRSTANSGGTSTILTNVPHDSTNSAGTATVRSYTANPTLGTLVGNIHSNLIYLPVFASTNPAVVDYNTIGDKGEQPIVLRGTSEVFSVNLNGAALLGTTNMNISISWTEE